MRGDARPARLCTSRTAANRPHTRGDQGKRVTAIYWGSSGAASTTSPKTFWGWHDKQLPNGTVIWISPSRNVSVMPLMHRNEREGEPIMTTTHDDTATSWRDLADQLTPKQTKSLDKI